MGYHSESSLGATPYFIYRGPMIGNIMIDCPRFDETLAGNLERLGGVKFLILTSRDTIADHEM